jgi:hypothetical protein
MKERTLQEVAEEFYRKVSRAFPVCSASDEFFYFPQVASPEKDWSKWDDFSQERVGEWADLLAGWEEAARREENSADRTALLHALKTLREQLMEVRPFAVQPTWHLTVAAAGLMEAFESGSNAAWSARVSGLPLFMERGARCLGTVPYIFMEMALRMARDLRNWLQGLDSRGWETERADTALAVFVEVLGKTEVKSSFRLTSDLPERIISSHLGCGTDIDGAMTEILEEIGEMQEILAAETARLAPGLTWPEAARRVPLVREDGRGVMDLYRREMRRLEKHCRNLGLLPSSLPPERLLAAEEVPPFLAAVRASDSYSCRPGHPPRGGTFYVFCPERTGEGRSPEFRMTTAHETWPGHHLLDFARWSLKNPLRRPLERPLFYEGWACLAEEIMFRTGAWQEEWDRFLLARRRLKRAARGMVDLGLQGGKMGLDDAAVVLEEAAFTPDEARAAVPKYALRPGYQVCYTLGLRRFLALLDNFPGTAGSFAGAVLGEGEISFDDLEEALKRAETD